MSDQSENQNELILQRLAGDDSEDIRAAAFDAGDSALAAAVDLLVKHIQSGNLGVQEAAEYALRQIRGSAAVAAVAPLLRSEDASVRNSAMDILREIGSDDMKTMAALLHDPDPDVRIFIADILGTSKQRVAVSLLSDALLNDPEVNVRYQAGVSLGTLGFPEADKPLSKALEDEEWVQFAAIEGLARLRADSCADILLGALPRASELVASTIINALGEMGNVKAVPILLKMLDAVSGPLRNKVVKAVVQILGPQSLALLGPKDMEKLREYLLASLDDEDILDTVLDGLSSVGGEAGTRAVLRLAGTLDPMRQHDLVDCVHNCLVGIGFNEALREGLSSGDELTMQAAVRACGSIGDSACAKALEEVFWTYDRDTQRTTAEYLAAMPGRSSDTFFLEVLNSHADVHVVRSALNYLGSSESAVAAAPKMLELLDSPYFDVKEAALEACLALNDPDTNDALAALFKSSDPVQRMMGAYSMGRIDSRRYLHELTEALEDEIPDIRKVALEAIGELCGESPDMWALLSPRLADENRDVRLAMVAILGRASSPKADALLQGALDDEDDWVRIRAVESLGQRRQPAVVPRLVQMLEDSELLVMLKLIEALGNIGGNVAFRAVLGLTSHSDPDVQQAAADAIARIRAEKGEEM